MIQLLISCTKYFTKETLLGRLGSVENELRHFGELSRIETSFSALNIQPNMSRSTSDRGNFASSNIPNKDKKIEEGEAFFVRREK